MTNKVDGKIFKGLRQRRSRRPPTRPTSLPVNLFMTSYHVAGFKLVSARSATSYSLGNKYIYVVDLLDTSFQCLWRPKMFVCLIHTCVLT